MGKRKSEPRFSVLPLVLPGGERLPTLVHAESLFPCRVALRWAVRYRRRRVQSSTLAHDLRTLARIYDWSTSQPDIGDLDDFICSGGSFTTKHLHSLNTHLEDQLSHEALNVAIGTAQDFLTWALDPGNRGGAGALTLRALSEEAAYITRVLNTVRTRGRGSERMTPLAPKELDAIRSAMGLLQREDGSWEIPMDGRKPRWPRNVFREGTWLRNVAMFELIIDTGIRRGETLKIKLPALPRGRDKDLRVVRNPDDAQDSRTHEPGVKSGERLVPVSRGTLHLLNLYVDAPAPLGRPRRGRTPYLFTTTSGRPLAISTTNDIITRIGEYAGVPLSWHPLRHTWAERTAEALKDDPRGWQKLKQLGGWHDDTTAQRYIEEALGRQAREHLANYQGALYAPDAA